MYCTNEQEEEMDVMLYMYMYMYMYYYIPSIHITCNRTTRYIIYKCHSYTNTCISYKCANHNTIKQSINYTVCAIHFTCTCIIYMYLYLVTIVPKSDLVYSQCIPVLHYQALHCLQSVYTLHHPPPHNQLLLGSSYNRRSS